ncbi:uncharacterized protein PFLUO_LOCUS5547 [Penicillium psychrofluorescens]|uniref:uncharacterized protein n=1 Tax=Penicillium psychrofluorescens TaxID=3158075 RepID=UPI003CCE05BB
MTVAHSIRRVAIIGAGPSGLASAKFLLAEKCFDQIDIFEQRLSVGGAWNPTPEKAAQSTPVPQTKPPQRDADLSHGPNFMSPLYDRLETNIPKELMRYSDKPFPADAPLFPKHQTVKKYLEEYAEDVKDLIHFGTNVFHVMLKDLQLGTWDIATMNVYTGGVKVRTYDAVVVASGHFNVPYLPDIAGISAWNQAYLGSISHSKFYNTPEPFRGKKVVVVGNSASGLDIGAQINEVCEGKLLVSRRSESYLGTAPNTDKIICPEIVEFLPPSRHDRAIRFADGRIEEHVDAVVFCTGYFYSYEFFPALQPPVETHGWRTENVYQQLFYIPYPTLVFPVLSQRVIPFPMAENQAAVFARVWSGRLSLPSRAAMEEWEQAEVARKGDGRAFHLLPFPQDADYLNFLYDWATRAAPRHELENNGNGKLGIYWTERERWMRARFPDIRRAFVQKGEQRSKIKSIEELGFDFGEWKREQEQLHADAMHTDGHPVALPFR